MATVLLTAEQALPGWACASEPYDGFGSEGRLATSL